jgi:tetratricopeptide (TPR) repeat protein
VSVSEGDPQYVAKVTKFVNEMGAKMNYNVAVDTAPQGGFMSENWMQAAEQRGIPAAFIVGKDGKIAWIGHPMTMDKPLAEIVAGTFNAKAYAEQQRRASMAEEELGKLGRSINELAGKGDFKGAVAKIDAFKTNDPAIAAQLAAVKVRLMTQYDEPGAARYVRDLANGMFKSDPMWLNDTAWGMIGDEPMWKNPDKALALQMAQRAVELTQGKEPALLDTLAMAYFKTGDKAKAIATQEKAVAILNKAGVDAKTKKEYTDRLEMFKKNR